MSKGLHFSNMAKYLYHLLDALLKWVSVGPIVKMVNIN